MMSAKDFIEKYKTDSKSEKPNCFLPYKPANDKIRYSKIISKRKDFIDVNLEGIKTFKKYL